MIKNIKRLPGINFKEGTELEMKKMIKIDAKMRKDREGEICVIF